MKNLLSVILFAGILTGCSPFRMQNQELITPIDQQVSVDNRTYDGFAQGRIGDILKTEWFTFQLNEVNFLSEYDGYVAAEDNELIVANLTIKNTFFEPILFANWEFSLLLENNEDVIEIEPLNLNYMSGSAPSEFELKRGEVVTYDFVYEVPKDNFGEYSIAFVEAYEDDFVGDWYFIYFEK